MPNLDLTQYTIYSDQLFKTKEEIDASKGTPLKQTTEEGDLFYWYGSIVPHKSELYRFENNKVVWVSINMDPQNVSVKEFIDEWGEPEYSVKRYKEANDSLQNKVIAWPSKGRVLIASGNDQYARVTRLEFFEPETLEQYLTNWGKDYADKEKVVLGDPVVTTPGASVSEQPAEALKPFYQDSQIILLSTLLLICILVGVSFFLLNIKRFWKSKA